MFTATEAVLIFFSGVMCTILFQITHDGKGIIIKVPLPARPTPTGASNPETSKSQGYREKYIIPVSP